MPRSRADRAERIAQLCHTGFDAAVLLATARAHRVEGFVEDGLARAAITLPPEQQKLLEQRAAQSRAQMLRNAGEEVRLSKLFRSEGFEPVFVKGATLAILAHSSLSLKTSWDSDMVVAPGDLATARSVLLQAGYVLNLPGIENPKLIERFFARNKETVWVNDERRSTVELHTALVDSPRQLPGVGPDAATRLVEIARGASVRTLARPELYAYLAVHGTNHQWERLKWLTDVAALIDRGPCSADELHAAACRMGGGRSSGCALLLCAELLGTPLSAALETGLERDPAVASLATRSRSAMRSVATIDQDTFAGVRREVQRLQAQRMQGESLRDRIAITRVQLSLAATPDRLALPTWLLPLHTLIWLPFRLATRPWRKRQNSRGKTASKP